MAPEDPEAPEDPGAPASEPPVAEPAEPLENEESLEGEPIDPSPSPSLSPDPTPHCEILEDSPAAATTPAPPALLPQTPEASEAQAEDAHLEITEEDAPPEASHLLVVVPRASTARLMRESLLSFTHARIDTTLDPLRGFELALQRPYRLFLFAMEFETLSGPLLYELISKAYASGRMPSPLAPGVVFVRERGDPQLGPEYAGDVRIKGILTKPVRIDRLLAAVADSIELRDPTQAPTSRKR